LQFIFFFASPAEVLAYLKARPFFPSSVSWLHKIY